MDVLANLSPLALNPALVVILSPRRESGHQTCQGHEQRQAADTTLAPLILWLDLRHLSPNGIFLSKPPLVVSWFSQLISIHDADSPDGVVSK